MKPLNVAVIGFGNHFVRHHLPRLKKYESDIKIVAIGDILEDDEPGIMKLLREEGSNLAPSFYATNLEVAPSDTTALKKLLNTHASTLDAVFISTPHTKHYYQAKQCLEAGLHVFVDKPLALKYDQAQELVEIANKNNCELVVGSQRRYEHVFDYAKRVIEAGELGRILNINSIISAPKNHLRGWWGHRKWAGAGGVLWNLAWHSLDTIVYLVEKRAVAVDGNLYQPTYVEMDITSIEDSRIDVEAYASILTHFEDDLAVTLTANVGGPSNSAYERIQIWGTGGVLTLDRFKPRYDRQPAVVTHQMADGRLIEPDLSLAVAQAWAPIEAFLNVISSTTERERQQAQKLVLSTGAKSLETVRILEGAYNSHKNAQRVMLNQIS